MRTSESIRIGAQTYSVTREDVVAASKREAPRRINTYYVDVEGHRFPPKQLIRTATGAAGFFDSAAAVKLLVALGFHVDRV